MTLTELSVEYRAHARALDLRIGQLEERLQQTRDESERCLLEARIHMLSTMLREAREQGIVKITISAPGGSEDFLSERLESAFGLRNAFVYKTPEVGADKSFYEQSARIS